MPISDQGGAISFPYRRQWKFSVDPLSETSFRYKDKNALESWIILFFFPGKNSLSPFFFLLADRLLRVKLTTNMLCFWVTRESRNPKVRLWIRSWTQYRILLLRSSIKELVIPLQICKLVPQMSTGVGGGGFSKSYSPHTLFGWVTLSWCPYQAGVEFLRVEGRRGKLLHSEEFTKSVNERPIAWPREGTDTEPGLLPCWPWHNFDIIKNTHQSPLYYIMYEK